MKRLEYIDIARGICIILVVIGHYIPTNTPSWYTRMIRIIYYFHMPLFMYVSGFVYRSRAMQKKAPYKEFILNKFNRLIIPYLIISFLVISIKLLSKDKFYLENPVSLFSFIEILYYPAAGYFLWFVYVLFLIFLIIPFFDTNKKINALLILSLILMVVPIHVPDIFCLSLLKNYIFYFVLGCFSCQNSSFKNILNKIPSLASTIGFILIYMVKQSYTNPNKIIWSNIFSIILALLGIHLIIKISQLIEQKAGKSKTIILQISTFSYTIYLFHTSFQGLLKSILVKISLSNFIHENILFCVQVFIVNFSAIIGSIMIHKIYYVIKDKYIKQV